MISGLGGGGRKQLTKSASIDTAPSFSPDGSQIVFESDRSGSQQIYMMSASGASPNGSASARALPTPVWSPRGDLIAFTKIVGGRFHIGDAARRLERAAPDRELYRRGPDTGPERAVLMFFRESPGESGGPQIYTVDVTGGTCAGPDRRLRLGPVPVRIAGLT